MWGKNKKKKEKKKLVSKIQPCVHKSLLTAAVFIKEELRDILIFGSLKV